MQNKNKATAALAISAAGAATTLPGIIPSLTAWAASSATGGILLGLFNHGFIAATIGGLADWFAVTALFRKPLGISYRTEILKRNRPRIMNAIVDFVGKDLLNIENIMEIVRDENTAKLFIEYIEKNQGREKIKELARDVLTELFSSLDTNTISKAAAPILENEVKNIDAEKFLDAIIKVITSDKHSKKILTLLFDTGLKILKSEHIQDAILSQITELREAYEGDSAGRAFVLSSMDLTDEKILSILNENVERKIIRTMEVLNVNGLVDSETAAAAKSLTNSFGNFFTSAVGDINKKNFLTDFKNFFTETFDISTFIRDFLNIKIKGEVDPKILEKINRQSAANPQNSRIVKIDRQAPVWLEGIQTLIDKKIDEFINSPKLQENFDNIIKGFIGNLLREYHGQIPKMIRERLNKLDDDELNEFVENKIFDDLQMIRINCSICGAAAGMFLYLVSLAIERLAV